MNLDGHMKLNAFMVWMLCVGSVHISALILSSESINSESTQPSDFSLQEDVLQRPTIASESDVICDKLSDTHIVTDRTSGHLKEISKSDSNDEQIKFETVVPKTETQLPHPGVLEMKENVVIPEQEISTEKTSQENVVPSVVVPTLVSVEDTTKEIFIEAPLVEDIKEIIADGKNESTILEKQLTSSGTDEVAARENVSSAESIQVDVNKIESADGIGSVEQNEFNLTVEENQIPVFSEWAQKRMEEVEKEVEQESANASTMKKNAPTANSKPPVLKLKNSKNYASPDCGAKIIAANSESSGTGYVLTSTRDEYLLSPCKSRIWFVVELCEAIQAERIDLANFELFSSSPKNFSIGVSSRFPTRDWTNVGKFIAKDERYIQSFDLYPHLFGKYVRVDIHSHYNSEHFCPISLFRVYGTSEFEAFETENRQHPLEDIDDDDVDDLESDSNKGKTNIFKSASDAVMSIVDTVKKAASFVKPGNKTVDIDSHNTLNSHPLNDKCISPNHAISCENCSDETTQEVTALVQCKQQLLNRLLNINIIRNSLYKSRICSVLIGSDLNINCNEPIDVNGTTSKQLTDLQMDYITHLFSLKYITAMCNLLAAGDRKLTWNSTIPVISEPPINVTIDKKIGDPILSSDQLKQQPAVQTVPTIRTDALLDSPSATQENSNEKQAPNEQNENIPSESSESGQEYTIEQSAEMTEGDKTESTIASSITENMDVVADKNEQNIFNVIDSTETSAEKSASQVPAVEIPTNEPSNTRIEQETPPSVIILPETTTESIPTTTPTPAINDLNDATEEQAQNGWTNTPQFGQKLHSESVFLRLANRVKALERNMSLSGQYLEELSRRYKKQVEELQMSFAKTLVNIEEQSRKNLERKQELFEQNQRLRDELDILTERIFSWRNILICCGCFTCVQILIFHIILKIWGRKYGLEPNHSSSSVSSDTSSVEVISRKRKSGNVPVKFRRKSAEEKRERNPSESSSSALQRRPSTEALNITGTYADLLIDDSNTVRNSSSNSDYPNAKGTKNTHYNKNTASESHAADISGYVKIEDLKELYDRPTDEYEFYGPVPELKSHGSSSQAEDCGSATTLDSSLDGVPSQPKKAKPFRNKYKQRRLSSPSFFKSPFSSGSAAQSTGWEWHRSKKSHYSSQIYNKKSKSESPPSLKPNGINNNNSMPASNNSKSVEANQKPKRNDPVRTSISSSIDERKTSGSFKRILKKIF